MAQSENGHCTMFFIWNRFKLFLQFHESYKNDWSDFVYSFKEHFCAQKTAYYAQVEAQASMKKGTENVRNFPPKVHHLVEKGWCKESAATFNIKCNEMLTKGPSKNLKDFAQER